MRRDRIKPLYRKVNRKSSYQCRCAEAKGGRFAWARNSKAMRQFDGRYLPMGHATSNYVPTGYDYTPLFRYLLSRVGDPWDDIYAYVKPRLNTTEPIWWLVSRTGFPKDNIAFCRLSESSYWSRLWIDAEGRLQRVDPAQANATPGCRCHTCSFNASRIGRDR